jgi:hypothetical protein
LLSLQWVATTNFQFVAVVTAALIKRTPVWPCSTLYAGSTYVEALDRLPIHDYPNLVHCLSVAGHCYGLLEPVCNIILHAIAHGGPSDLQGPYKREDITAEFLSKIRSSWYWLRTAERSLDGLTAFLMSWYRYLTLDQAVGYLYLAKADLYLAMDLVEREYHTQCVVEEALPPPAFDDDAWFLTIRDSLMYAPSTPTLTAWSRSRRRRLVLTMWTRLRHGCCIPIRSAARSLSTTSTTL